MIDPCAIGVDQVHLAIDLGSTHRSKYFVSGLYLTRDLMPSTEHKLAHRYYRHYMACYKIDYYPSLCNAVAWDVYLLYWIGISVGHGVTGNSVP